MTAPARSAGIPGRHTRRSQGAAVKAPPGAWTHHAACADRDLDPALWDLALTGEHRPARDARHDTALAICRACPVRRDCDTTASLNEEAGVWGGRIRVPDWYPNNHNLRSARTVPPAAVTPAA